MANMEIITSKRTRLPRVTDRTMVIGATGEGKTVVALYILSFQPFHIMPWVIIDYKREHYIGDLENEGATLLYDNRKMPGKKFPAPPVHPGLYILRPDPDQKTEIDTFLLELWRNGNTGLFCDEAFMIPQKRPFKSYDALLTQGRSLNCPMIMLYQRPVDMSQYATSQADFWAVLNLRKKDDIDRAAEYVGEARSPGGQIVTVNDRLPKYHWLWYDVSEDSCVVMAPVPSPELIIASFRTRLQPAKAETVTEVIEERPRLRLI